MEPKYLTIRVRFNNTNPGSEEHLKEVLRNYLGSKGALSSENIVIEI